MKTDVSNFKLKIDLKPSAYHGNTVRKNLSQTLWKKIRLKVLEEHNHTCSICGYTPPMDELKRLHVHEIEEYGKDELLCILNGLELICENCHNFHHIGRMYSVLTKEQIDKLEKHFMKVNQCTHKDYKDYFKDFVVKKREASMEAIREHIAQSKKQSISKEKTILDETVLYRIEGDIPFKEEAIKQLTNKGLYRFYDDEE